MKLRPIRAADLFCGSGGFSAGLVKAVKELFPGRELDMVAVNHWQVAIDTHKLNHPDVEHYCADLEHMKPREAVPGGVLDILLAAPSCTYHSRARGGRPVYDQQRMDPWHVVRWCTDLRVHRLIVENVPEFVKWGPCDQRNGKPIKSREGEYFRAWVAALKAIGMRLDWKVLNCAGYGDATTRERFFLYGRGDRKPIRFPEYTHAKHGDQDLFGTRKPWRSAAECIDWSNPGTSIFTRPRPLVKNTLLRLHSGASRNHWPKQHIEALQALIDGRKPRLKVTREEAEEIAAILGIPLVMSTASGGVARGVDKPFPTFTGGGQKGATPHFAEPVVMAVGSNGAARSVRNPCPAITTGGAPAGNARPHFAQPIILHKANSDGGRPGRPVTEPVNTITTNNAGALCRPILTPYYGGGSGLTGQSVDDPMPAQGTRDRFALAQPFLVPNFGEAAGQSPRTHGVDGPIPTITARGHIQLARPFLSLCTHGNAGNASRAVDDPLMTLTTAKVGEITLATPAIAEDFYIDILYRMLHWTELARATSLIDDDITYQFTGTATEITKQIGNAVPRRTAAALCIEALAA